jgi:hypothetical protein
MTDKTKFDVLRTLLQRAADAPWIASGGMVSHKPAGCAHHSGYTLGQFDNPADAQLVVELVNSAPGLLKALESMSTAHGRDDAEDQQAAGE